MTSSTARPVKRVRETPGAPPRHGEAQRYRRLPLADCLRGYLADRSGDRVTRWTHAVRQVVQLAHRGSHSTQKSDRAWIRIQHSVKRPAGGEVDQVPSHGVGIGRFVGRGEGDGAPTIIHRDE